MQDSNVDELRAAGIIAVQVSATCIQFFQDGNLILDWNDDRLLSAKDIWSSLEFREWSYMFNYLRYEDDNEVIVEFYGRYIDATDSSELKMDDSQSLTVEVSSLIDLVMNEMEADFARGDHECVRELLGFVPVNNLKGYLPSLF